MTRYRHSFDPDSSYGSALRLVEASARVEGVALDVGCGYGALAEPLTEAGLTYVGVDIEPAALADLAARGHEVHALGLLLPEPELAGALQALVGDRPVALVLALDVLEHLLDVPATLRALAAVAAPHEAELVVSYPNVTHFDVAAKLVLGRWDTTDEGLLDRTHTQFLAGPDLPGVFAAAGWREVDRDDVVRSSSDQCFPSYAPVLRPGAPARELLWGWRHRADAYGSTFQFVRRFGLGDPGPDRPDDGGAGLDEDRRFATVVAVIGSEGRPSAADQALLDDLAAQDLAEEVTVVVVESSADGRDHDAVNDALRQARSRYVFVVRSGDRWGPDHLSACARVAGRAPGVVLRARARVCSPEGDQGDRQGFAEVIADAEPIETSVLDPVHVGTDLPVVAGAVGLPAQVVQAMGYVLDPDDGEASFAVLAAQAAQLCGVQPVDDATVVVPVGAVIDAGVVADRTNRAMNRAPMVLRAGDASRLAEMRRRLGGSDGDLASLQTEAVARARQIEVLSAHVHELGARAKLLEDERDHWRGVAQRKFTVQLRALLSRALTKVVPPG